MVQTGWSMGEFRGGGGLAVDSRSPLMGLLIGG